MIYVGNGTVVEALGRGAVSSPLAKYQAKAHVWSQEIGEHKREQIALQANWMVAQKFRYNRWDIAVQFFKLQFRLHLPWRLKKSVICSVPAYQCYLSAHLYIAETVKTVIPSKSRCIGFWSAKGHWMCTHERRRQERT